MERSTQSRLPLELVLEVLEILAVQEDKASRLAAAYVAQTCRWLRTSDVGERARYFHALASKSLSEPDRLPSNIGYEAATLETRWPHQLPLEPPSKTQGTGIPADGCLRGDQYITLSFDKKSVQCYTTGADSSGHSVLSSSAQLETMVLSKTIHLSAEPLWITVDSEAENFIALYLGNSGHDIIETIQVMSLETGEAALPGGQARVDLEPNRLVKALQMTGPYILIHYFDEPDPVETAEVRHWGCTPEDPSIHFPVIWSRSTNTCFIDDEDIYEWFCLSLLAPNFLAVHYTADESTSGDSTTILDIHRLDQFSSRYVARLRVPLPARAGLHAPIVACGAKLTPGETGLCLITIGNSYWLVELSRLIEILYADASSTVPRLYDADWIRSHGHHHQLPKGWLSSTPAAVSGWRFTCLLWHVLGFESTCWELPVAVQFWDASPITSQSHEGGLRTFILGDKKINYYKHFADEYMAQVVDIGRYGVQMHGGRMLLTCRPERAENGGYTGENYFVHSWRL